MRDAQRNELVLLPSLKACRGPGGGLVLTSKFISGIKEYERYWPGRITALLELDEGLGSDMDHVEIFPNDGPVSIELRPRTEVAEAERLRRAAAVFAFLSPREARTAQLCRRLGVPLVYSSEYSLETELQIIRATVKNPLRRLRRSLWTKGAERKRLAALRLAAGIQCSGTPTYEVYKHVSENALLFFDNRVREKEVVSEGELEAKLANLERACPLRLVFGGRLIAMKGVLDLPHVARELERRGIDFALDIYGGGDLEPQLLRDIRAFGLESRVRLRGVLDFETGWIPMLKSEMDLFVCCHPQGDPSSTYPEVMSCGVPIVGYDNAAFRGIARHSGSGWLVPVGDPRALAAVIDRLDRARSEIAESARKARRFALEHAFERTYEARVRHLAQVANFG